MRSGEFRWAQLRVGLFIAIAIVVLFAAVLYFGLAGSPLKPYAQVHADFDDVSGLAVGSPVEMGGVLIGEIAGLELPNLQTSKIPVTLNIQPAALERLGPSSLAYNGSHALVGQRFVGLTPRKPDEQQLQSGATVQVRTSQALDQLVDEARDTLTQVRGLVADLKTLSSSFARAAESIDKGEGPLGMILHDQQMATQLREAAKNVRDLSDSAAHGKGTLAALAGDEKMANELRQSLAALSATTRRIQEGKGLIGKLTNDDQMAARLDRTLANVSEVSSRLSEGKGTLGALISDPALLQRLNALVVELDTLVTDVRRNPRRYLKLDPFSQQP